MRGSGDRLTGVYTPTVEERVEMHLEDGTYDLYVCPHAWALRQAMVEEETGAVRPMRCGLWSCRYCGPRKVNEWRQLIAEAHPTLHLTLTKAGQTVEAAARALTTFMQALRRGAKRKGRPAYAVEYFAVLERHTDFEANGFHWHLLLKGVEAIPYETIKDLWRSATHGRAENGWIQRIRNSKAIGYVTKYLMKDIFRAERGVKVVDCVVSGLVRDEQGKLVAAQEVVQEEVASQARRIRYSRGFFPLPVEELRARVFARVEPEQEQRQEPAMEVVMVEGGTGEEGQVPAKQPQPPRARWRLREVCPALETAEGYRLLLKQRLKEVLTERQAQGRRLSWRVLMIWNYQREQVCGMVW